jgi:transcription elongation GreA/GreB family factor
MSTKLYFTPEGYKAARARIDALETRLRELQAGVGEATELGNTWHDNPAYDQLVIDIRGVNRLLADEHAELRRGEIIQLPDVVTSVTIGCVVEVKFEDGSIEKFRIAGHGESDTDASVMSYNTPLARLLMRGQAGTKVEGTINNRKRSIEIISVGKA